MKEKFQDIGINIGSRNGEIQLTCPKCSHKRKKKTKKCLSVNVELVSLLL